jgi:CubicO group peptidase (beta-lactamase class C family)
MTTGHAMPWFSMTKIVTATLVMRLAERQFLDLDAPVQPLVPAMRHLRPAAWATRITVRHLLQHSAGLANPIPVKWIHSAGEPAPEPEEFLLGLLAKHSKLRSEPGARSSYSNLSTLILGSLVARVTGQRYEDGVRDEVLEPLGMARSGYTWDETGSETPPATGYHPRRSPMRVFLPRWVEGPSTGRWMALRPFLLDGAAYGGLVGTADDAARFAQMHLRDGDLDGRRVLAPESAAMMRTIDKRGRRLDLGLGWFAPVNDRDAEPPFVEHLGGGAGFFNVMRLYPTVGVGVVVMGNSTKYDIDAVARLALDYPSPGGPQR